MAYPLHRPPPFIAHLSELHAYFSVDGPKTVYVTDLGPSLINDFPTYDQSAAFLQYPEVQIIDANHNVLSSWTGEQNNHEFDIPAAGAYTIWLSTSQPGSDKGTGLLSVSE